MFSTLPNAVWRFAKFSAYFSMIQPMSQTSYFLSLIFRPSWIRLLPLSSVRSTALSLLVTLAFLLIPRSVALAQPQSLRLENTSSSGSTSQAMKNSRPEKAFNSESWLLLDQNDAVDQLLTRLVLSKIPPTYVEDRKWGRQSERWNGIAVERHGKGIEFERKKKLVNDGSWKKYSATLRNPEQEFQVKIRNLRQDADGNLSLEIHVEGHVDFKAQHVEWKKGVKLASLSLDGHTQVRIQIAMKVELSSEGNRFPPDLVFKPRATGSTIQLDDFRIDRVGKVGGEIAQQIGREAKKQLSDRMPEYEGKVVEKINAEFAKKESGYRLSFAEIQSSKWNKSFSKIFNSANPVGSPGSAKH